MAQKGIEDLPKISHKDIDPMYSKDEILDKLASAVHYLREAEANTEQRAVIELMYSVMKALAK